MGVSSPSQRYSSREPSKLRGQERGLSGDCRAASVRLASSRDSPAPWSCRGSWPHSGMCLPTSPGTLCPQLLPRDTLPQETLGQPGLRSWPPFSAAESCFAPCYQLSGSQGTGTCPGLFWSPLRAPEWTRIRLLQGQGKEGGSPPQGERVPHRHAFAQAVPSSGISFLLLPYSKTTSQASKQDETFPSSWVPPVPMSLFLMRGFSGAGSILQYHSAHL